MIRLRRHALEQNAPLQTQHHSDSGHSVKTHQTGVVHRSLCESIQTSTCAFTVSGRQ